MKNKEKDKMALIFFSGTYDKAVALMTLAVTGASMGMDVSIFFTFWGLSFLKKGKKYRRKNLLQKMMEFMLPGKRERMPSTFFNMMGAGPAMMKALMKKTRSASLEELFELSRNMGVKLYGCSTSCSIMGVEKENMIEDVEDVVGAAFFLKQAREAEISLFI